MNALQASVLTLSDSRLGGGNEPLAFLVGAIVLAAVWLILAALKGCGRRP